MEWWAWLIAAVFFVGFVFLGVASISEATYRRRAWNLWAAGAIDEAELRRRVDR